MKISSPHWNGIVTKVPMSVDFQVKREFLFRDFDSLIILFSGNVTFSSGEESKVISFQATPSLNKPETFAITLTAVYSNVSGGACLR